MTEEAFWGLVGRAAEQPGDLAERTDWLVEELTRLPLPRIADFDRLLRAVLGRADTAAMRAAARLVHGDELSGEAFRSFRLWLVGLGRRVFTRAVADPDTLAEDPRVLALATRPRDEWAEAEWPEWDGLADAAHLAHAEVTGDEDGLEPAPAAAPTRDPACPAGQAARLPRLSALFGRAAA